MWFINFAAPVGLLLLMVLPYFFWLGRPRVGAIRPGRDWLSVGLRLTIMLLLILGLAGSQIVRAADELAVVFLVDMSDSISQEQQDRAEEFVRTAIEGMTINDQAAIVVFGANALVERPMSSLAELAPITSVPQTLHTDLAEGIRLGLALFPAGTARRLVLLSDGVATIGDTVAAAQLATTTGVPIDVVVLSRPESSAEAWLSNVEAPTRVSLGESITVRVTAESTADMTANLRVLAGGQIIYEEGVNLRPGSNNFSIALRAAAQEFVRYSVELTPSNDQYYQNNRLSAYTEVIGPPRVLLVASDGTLDDDGTPFSEEAPQLLLALRGVGLEVEQITPAELPANLPQLSNYGAIILVNVNAKTLSPRKMEALQSYVRDLGGGLVVVGGPQSYGMGGYYHTPLEESLPVDMQIKDQERFPSVSIVIVIDRSGSMGVQEGNLTKIQLADEAAVRVVELLNDFDEITIIPVDTQASDVIGPISVSERESFIPLIRQIGVGGGGINVRTGIQAAAEALAGSPNQVKHIIVLADGDDSNEQEGVPELINSLVAEGVTISMVAIGGGQHVAWLQQMAELGQGRFHLTNEAANLPQIFTQETTSIQRSYLIEERFFPSQVNRSPILAGISQVPPLYGYVGSSAKDTAQVILETHLGDPLLAVWQYGLGRAVAWTSDATGRWGQDWVRWAGFPTFWAQTVRWTISQGRNSTVETVVDFTDEEARLIVDARDSNGIYLNNLSIGGNVVGPNGEVESVTLQQVAPGRYQTTFRPTEEGAYLIRVTGSDGQSSEAVVAQTTGWVLGYSPEYQLVGTNLPLLQNIAEISSGRDLSDNPLAVFEHNLPADRATRPIWVWLTLLAVVLLPADIAVRRVVVTRRDMERAWAATFGRLHPEPVTTERNEQLSRLFEAKQRAVTAGDQSTPPPPSFSPPTQPADKPTIAPSPPPTPPPSVPAGNSPLASRLLEKRRQTGKSD